jgi:hypothetical protein
MVLGNGNKGSINSEIKTEIRKEAAKWTVGAFIFLFTIAVSGWGFYLQNKLDSYITNKVKGVPSQAIVSFDIADGCPEGWDTFNDAKSRFIIGAGRGEDLSSRPFRSLSNVESVKLREANIPAHQHDTLIAVVEPTPWGNGSSKNAVVGTSFQHFQTALSSPSGKSDPDGVSILPPYIALTFCKKR